MLLDHIYTCFEMSSVLDLIILLQFLHFQATVIKIVGQNLSQVSRGKYLLICFENVVA